MNKFEKVTTGLGEECGVFGAYNMDGGDVASHRILWAFCITAQRSGKLWHCSDRYVWRTESSLEKRSGTGE